eukprot:CAMPEP_0185774328 /NCGR_PEP_ID=MMETSP1174-20130828/77662_1 /TAXON_ID=35687 /ORGANISM="Dictyocha speculum, Strain CCMP1381" /LENGTH=356 /DNA_ID=CAMNT_0028461435 /DNA_START=39 /DNA_END=1109 /DNA_ORIENTATION=+
MTGKDGDDQLLKGQLEVADQQLRSSAESCQTAILEIEKLKTAQHDSDELHNADIRAMEKSYQKELRQLTDTNRRTASELKNTQRELQSSTDRNKNLDAQCQDLKQIVGKLTAEAKETPKLQSIVAAQKAKMTMMQRSYDALRKDLDASRDDLVLLTKALENKTEAHDLLVEKGKLQITETALATKELIADALRERDAEHQLHLDEARLSETAAKDKYDALSKVLTGCQTELHERQTELDKLHSQHDTTPVVAARWNGILVTTGKLDFSGPLLGRALSLLPADMIADIRMEFGLEQSDLCKISDLLAPDENSEELLLKEWLENKYANRNICDSNTNENPLHWKNIENHPRYGSSYGT